MQYLLTYLLAISSFHEVNFSGLKSCLYVDVLNSSTKVGSKLEDASSDLFPGPVSTKKVLKECSPSPMILSEAFVSQVEYRIQSKIIPSKH